MKTDTRSDFDSPWKEAVEIFFPAFMSFFFPAIDAEIDWSKGYQFLDKELEKVVRDAQSGRRYVDKLVQVFLKEGRETWLLIHIEIQNDRDRDFPERMYIYHYRLFDRYRVDIVSLAVLSDADARYRPKVYRTGRWGCKLTFQFPIAKVLDYGRDWAALEANPNSFAVVVMAHLKAKAVKQGEERKQWKLYLVKLLYQRGYTRQQVLELFRFIDWLLVLPPGLDKTFWAELSKFEEEQRMPYVTSVERIGIEKGLQQGLQQGALQAARDMLLHAIAVRFGEKPNDVVQVVNAIEVKETLQSLLEQVICCADLAAFRAALRQAAR